VVLAVLPLNLREGLDGSGEARTWLLPMIRRHVRGARLDYWHRSLMPLAKQLGARAAAAGKAGQRTLAATCHALELQLWATLPAFCSWPADGAAAFRSLAKDLGAAFTARGDLRVPICQALRRLCLQSRRALLEAGDRALLAGDVAVEPLGAGAACVRRVCMYHQGVRGSG
jgi:ribosomal RNA-processing protein 12